MVSHLTDLTKEIGALKFEQTGLQAQTQASQPARLDYLEGFCQGLQREMVALRSFAIGNGAELRRRPNGAEIDTLKAQVENLQRQMQELTAMLVRCYAIDSLEIHCSRREQPLLLLLLSSFESYVTSK